MTDIKISVGELSRLNQRGDINFRFTGKSSALEGIRGHQSVQKQRGEGYEVEKSVALLVNRGEHTIKVQGRVDGYISVQPLVEEIKTHRIAIHQLPEQVIATHQAQLDIYAHILCQTQMLPAITTRLCYYNLDDGSEDFIEREQTASELAIHFDRLIAHYISWLDATDRWRALRNKTIVSADFPHDEYRPGQRDMAVAVYRAATTNQQVVLQAPTGIGKTLAALFPAVKALPDNDHEKIFYLSAKSSGQSMAEAAITQMQQSGMQLRSITLTAKQKICFTPGAPCDPDHCDYAKGYYDRLDQGVEDILHNNTQLSREVIETSAHKHRLCPFELSLDLSREADVIICDYNYVFDPAVYLRRFFEDNQGAYTLLLDEAHNLVDRGREMFSARLIKNDFLALRRQIKEHSPLVAKALTRINSHFLSMRKLLCSLSPTNTTAIDSSRQGTLEALPRNFIKSLRGFCSAAELLLREETSKPFQQALLTTYFDCLRFIKTEEQADQQYQTLFSKTAEGWQLKLFCVNPAARLNLGFARMKASICFSATMNPQQYFKHLLGLNEQSQWYQLPSPFDQRNLGVVIAPFIATTYQNRDSSKIALVDLIARVVQSKPGNYLIYFPSHAYLQLIYALVQQKYPEIRLVQQQRSMSAEQQQAFLECFKSDKQIVGFAVMGGVFAEGVDLKGSRLIGVVVVGVGLPQINLEREMIRQHWQQHDTGFEFAYQYPGMSKVLQTAGRVIRDNADKGIICLADSRFVETRYRQLFPAEWQPKTAKSAEQLSHYLGDFWQGHSLTPHYNRHTAHKHQDSGSSE